LAVSQASPKLTGGCQCGAVRYRLDAEPHDANICHCRMCQKAGGGPFMAFGSVPRTAFAVTRGEIAVYRSSEIADRGFCRDCGTPLTYMGRGANHMSVTLGSLDEPGRVAPDVQLGIEGEVVWLRSSLTKPATRSEDWLSSKRLESAGSHQHPDYDT
jgi:hypothetical protein